MSDSAAQSPTPNAPWRIVRRSNQLGTRRLIVVGHDTKPVAEFNPCRNEQTVSARSEAQARLIAAAPDYFAAAAPLVDLMTGWTGPDEVTFAVTAGELRALAAAHAKATGAAR